MSTNNQQIIPVCKATNCLWWSRTSNSATETNFSVGQHQCL